MDKEQANNVFSEIEHNLLEFYSEMRWILNSKRGKGFQFMMLSRAFESLLDRNMMIKEGAFGKQKIISPLDKL